MKTYLLLVIFLIPVYGRAQSSISMSGLDQGQLQIGVGVGAGSGSSVGGGGYVRATPYAQYFLKDGLALRLEGRYTNNGRDGNRYLGAGLSTQYHFLRTKRFSAYAQAGYFYGRSDYRLYRILDQTPTSAQLERYREHFNYGMLNTALGAQYQLGPRWSIIALVEKNFGQEVGRIGADRHNFTLGVNFRIK